MGPLPGRELPNDRPKSGLEPEGRPWGLLAALNPSVMLAGFLLLGLKVGASRFKQPRDRILKNNESTRTGKAFSKVMGGSVRYGIRSSDSKQHVEIKPQLESGNSEDSPTDFYDADPISSAI